MRILNNLSELTRSLWHKHPQYVSATRLVLLFLFFFFFPSLRNTNESANAVWADLGSRTPVLYKCTPGLPASCPQLFLLHDMHDQKYRNQVKQKPTKPCHTALWKELAWTEESGDAASLLLFNRGASLLIWTAELGIASVIIITSGREELFLKELPGGQRAASKRKNNQLCPLYI